MAAQGVTKLAQHGLVLLQPRGRPRQLRIGSGGGSGSCCFRFPSASTMVAGNKRHATGTRGIATIFSLPQPPPLVLRQSRSIGKTALSLLPYPSSAPASRPAPILSPPAILYSDNHLLAVNKPAGWHSVPNNTPKRPGGWNREDAGFTGGGDESDNGRSATGGRKCLLTHLKSRGLGGGSKKDFLVPLHRIDQPCTGVLLFGKTSKAASRVTGVWKGTRKKRKSTSSPRGVVKDYLCVVPTSRLGALEEASTEGTGTKDKSETNGDCSEFPASLEHSLAGDGTPWKELEGLMLRRSEERRNNRPRHRQLQRKQQQQYYNNRLRKGRSVKIVRKQQQQQQHLGGEASTSPSDFYGYDHETDNALVRPVAVRWKVVRVPTIDPAFTLLLVRTSEGARHMVRALLAQVGNCPIVGDLRYWTQGRGGTGNGHSDANDPLGDRSVALHAHGLYFDKRRLRLGSLDTFGFRAPVPPAWESFFGIGDHQVRNLW